MVFLLYLPHDGIFRSQDEIDRHISKDSETGEVKMLQPNAKVGDLRFIDTKATA